jgi:hypothetical protein
VPGRYFTITLAIYENQYQLLKKVEDQDDLVRSVNIWDLQIAMIFLGCLILTCGATFGLELGYSIYSPYINAYVSRALHRLQILCF